MSDSQFPAGTETPGWRHSNRESQQTSSQRQQQSGCRHLGERRRKKKENRSILEIFDPSTFWLYQKPFVKENELVLNFLRGDVSISLQGHAFVHYLEMTMCHLSSIIASMSL